uniref:Uncharacterized protein n=1 Tax=Setaria digitata TaxID=48799 RepID=A0A915PFT7_9BILA
MCCLDLTLSDLTIVGTTSGSVAHSVLSSCDDQANSSIIGQEIVPSTAQLLSVNPPLIDPVTEPTISFSDQGEFELPPPMSELSSAVADAAASRNASFASFHRNSIFHFVQFISIHSGSSSSC